MFLSRRGLYLSLLLDTEFSVKRQYILSRSHSLGLWSWVASAPLQQVFQLRKEDCGLKRRRDNRAWLISSRFNFRVVGDGGLFNILYGLS